MSIAIQNTLESVYGIYFGKESNGYNGPHGDRQAGCVIAENQSHDEIIKNLVASDFLSQWNEYVIIDNKCSMHIHHKLNGKIGGIALVLMYEEDLEPKQNSKVKVFKEIDLRYTNTEEKLEALTKAGFELDEIVEIALGVADEKYLILETLGCQG